MVESLLLGSLTVLGVYKYSHNMLLNFLLNECA